MNYQAFISTLQEKSLPPSLPIMLQALWYDAKGNWQKAHEIAQSKEGTPDYDRLHAYLHRKEGDAWNANYWYRHCGEKMPTVSLSEEWTMLAQRFSD